jgi:hypothetical protein
MRGTIVLVIVAILAGCSPTQESKLDADRILKMAGDEAGLIAAPKDKLTRQLNIANRQAETGKPTESRATLALARKTLETADKDAFNNQQRLAGWISLSELSRKVEDKAFANSALDEAIRSLNELKPPQARCEYVLGVEHELKELRGEKEAAKLLATAGDWATSLIEPSTRRAAYLDFAQQLFECDDYEGARTLLRKDEDAAWRSDSLMAISDRARYSQGRQWWQALPSAEVTRTADSGQNVKQNFSKRLDFESNYQRQQ